ncbi:hypothetical protein [Nannocystis sp.]|uniref:hypothetical protein n=1 Tax=Nannocystis sp. TaxID=1962667 RepID=UPI0025ECA55A|nr:hypothetical protein [Nannocystis sp.]
MTPARCAPGSPSSPSPSVACAPPGDSATGSSDTSDASTSAMGTGEPTTTASTGPTCPSGQENCPCGDDLACADDLVCVFAVCIALDCEPGSDGCVCGPEAACGPDLACNSGNLCRPDGQCPYTDDGSCDVPEFCPAGSDVNDCCATQAGVCEELGMGGDCPPGTDMFDCGYCIYTDDGGCDEPDLCAPGTDKNDCCASIEDGVCDEMGMGGQCPQGSDMFDCGYCPTPEDGVCDEIEDSDGLCPPGPTLSTAAPTEGRRLRGNGHGRHVPARLRHLGLRLLPVGR